MKFGKIRIEDGYLVFTKRMMINNLPCKDILWAYMRREDGDASEGRRIITNYLVICTRRKKHYQFDMTEKEVEECIRLLRVFNPEMAVGYPRGARLPLKSLPNTRDLGAIVALDGRHIMPKKLIRSGELYHISISDRDVLTKDYKVKTVIDLRTERERVQKPDTIMAGVKYYHIPIIDEETSGITRTGSMEESLERVLRSNGGNAQEYMERLYGNFILDDFSVKQYARFLDVLLDHEDGAVLWHCSAGKDRAGVATVLLLCALGVSRKTIREDYMRSNQYLESELTYMRRYLEAMGAENGLILNNIQILYQVQQSYISEVFRVIEREYGTVSRFLRRALYLTPKAIQELREKYLI